MEFPIPHRGARLPEIYVHDSGPHDRYGTSSRSSSYGSAASTAPIPMSIPNSNSRDYVPPPLPPPKHIADIANGGHTGQDIAWKWGNSQEDSGWGRPSPSVAPGSSLYGNFSSRGGSLMEDRSEVQRTNLSSNVKYTRDFDTREYSYPRIDEGYASLSGTSIGSTKSRYQESSSLRSGFQSSVHDSYRSNAQAFDKSLLQKLDARRGSDNKTPPRGHPKSPFSSSANDSSPTSRIAMEHRHQLKPLSLPILPGRPNFVESPLSRWGDPPSSSAISPGNPFPRFGQQTEFRSPSEAADFDRSPLSFTRRHGSGSGSVTSVCDDVSSVTSRSRGDSYDQRGSPDNDVDFQMDEAGLRRLQIDDYSSRHDAYSPGGATAGQKRRASSPPEDGGPPLHTPGSASDLFRRRESGSRTSPGPRFHTNSSSMSSTTSERRSNSYSTTLSIGGSSITSLCSSTLGRLSPGGISPIPTDSCDSPYVTSISLNPSPSAIQRASHGRAMSDTRPLMTSRKLSDPSGHSKSNSTPKMVGVWICECCPKKPKKFECQEDLQTHEQEKQYECQYCPNRFKNKNEAERHQNSLHLRRHSWSCAALSGYAAAFHISPSRPNDADSCGYCGEDFFRSGRDTTPSITAQQVKLATEQDWEARIAHLQDMHKFGECNHAKKFFRADHFRQHLKHSHAGTSGKWTNMLENACMKDEPLPEPIRGPGARVGRINEEDEIL